MSRRTLPASVLALFTVAIAAVTGCRSPRLSTPSAALVTTGETSKWTRTGRYDEAVRLCHEFARAYDGVRCIELARTLQDRPIVALEVLRAPQKPTILIQAGIHAGEIEGKDAGFWFLRDLLDGNVAPGALAAVNVVFVPCINPDGHERFGPHNRPNQRGPEQMGFRTNAARHNLNRDFMKVETREIAAILKIFRDHDPLVFIDLHATDGAKFEHDIAVMVAPFASRADALDETAGEVSRQLQRRLTALGHLPLSFYPSFEVEDDPASGFALGEAPLRFSQAYVAARSRLAILVETHSWRTYSERARSTYHTLQALLERATTDAPRWHDAAERARSADQSLRGRNLDLVYENGPHVTEIEFRGYAYERVPSDISGATWTRYDETRPEIWRVPLRDEIVPKVTVRVPTEGYVIDGGYAAIVAPLLDHHGIAYRPLAAGTRVEVETFRASKVERGSLFEGRTRMTLAGAWTRETRTLDRGAIFVSLRQSNVRMIVHLFDPAGPDSLAQWGFFATAFERKEYMESYVAEEVARMQLAKDPSLRGRFDAALAADPELAASAARRLEWFYRRHPSWDERLDLLPVYRCDHVP